jgi:ATP/ADP translocase
MYVQLTMAVVLLLLLLLLQVFARASKYSLFDPAKEMVRQQLN